MDPDRRTACLILTDVEVRGAYSNLAVKRRLAEERPPGPAFVRELTYGVLENRMLLDYMIDALIPGDVAKVKKDVLVILRMGIYQMAFMDSVPEYAAVSESVELAGRFAKGREGFVNGVLRSFQRKKDRIELPDRADDEVRYLSVRYSYAPWIVELWLERYGPTETERLLAAGNGTPRLCIRPNRLKTSRDGLAGLLAEEGFVTEPGRISENALYADGHGPDGRGLLDTDLYANGYFSVQDEAAQAAVEIMDPRPGETVMDMCAAPGGKCLACAEMMGNEGAILASDIYENRIKMIGREAARLGVSIVHTAVRDASVPDSGLEGKADRVLLDVPCSGLGVVRRKPEIKYKGCRAGAMALAEKQLKMLEASAGYVKKSGTLMYVTCTIDPYENERVTDLFTEPRDDFRVASRKQFLPETDGTDGFFICAMEKTR